LNTSLLIVVFLKKDETSTIILLGPELELFF